MININGKTFYGNVTIVNGQVISGGLYQDSSSNKKFDDTKKESADGVKRITINSDVNVNVTACNTKEITAHLYGSATTNVDVNFSVKRNFNEVYVVAEIKTDMSCSSYNDLVLDVQIPIKAYEEIHVASKNNKINIESSVSANAIKVDSKNGMVNVSAIFHKLTVNSKNGCINVDSKAYCDVILGITGQNGKIDVSIKNISNSKVSVHSKNGICKNMPRLDGRYTVYGDIRTKNGIVNFH